MRTWRARDEELARDVASAEQALDEATSTRAKLASDAARAGRTIEDIRQRVEEAEAELHDLDTLLDDARHAMGYRFPDSRWWQDREHRELHPLWTDQEFNHARSDLFLEALRLHKVFLRHAATKMRQSLDAALDIAAGQASASVPRSTAIEAWRALFFVLPVVSTTFASFGRLFSHLGREALGWLLIDEAGQANPQEAVGALWRSKRALVVGDPLQLTPVNTLPASAEHAIRRAFDVDEHWLPRRLSVQRLADRVTPLGTWLTENDDKIWVGSPLIVHRRCDQPMFGIANKIAYDGLMINGTSPAAKEAFDRRHPSLPASKWIDVSSENAEGRWIPAEGEELRHVLQQLARLGVDMSTVMVVGPFRDVAFNVKRITRPYPDIVSGTVHRSQGKQADIVILVLGSDPQRPGSRRWAAETPNLLNVAVSRAKRRLYVIGNHRAWKSHPHFDVLATALAREAPRPR